MGSRKKPLIRACSQCMFSTWDPVAWTMAVGAGWPGRLACVNCAEAPGQLRQVPPGGTCRNFRPRGRGPGRTAPAVDPKTVINPWTTHKVPRGSKVRKVKLSRGLFATVDARDFKKLNKYKWYARPCGCNVYAYRKIAGGTRFMHQAILHAPRGMVVDHIDGNGLNNCRCNLRICTRQQNAANKKGPLGVSGYMGVYPTRGRWYASFTHEGVVYYLGTFADPAEAAKVRDRVAYELSHGHARLNFPQDFPAWRPGRWPAEKKATKKKRPEEGKRRRVCLPGGFEAKRSSAD